MDSLRVSRVSLVVLLLSSALLLGGCRVVLSTPTLKATVVPTQRPTATATATPKPTMTPAPQPLDLSVQHTNDVSGYTDPCG